MLIMLLCKFYALGKGLGKRCFVFGGEHTDVVVGVFHHHIAAHKQPTGHPADGRDGLQGDGTTAPAQAHPAMNDAQFRIGEHIVGMDGTVDAARIGHHEQPAEHGHGPSAKPETIESGNSNEQNAAQLAQREPMMK